MLPERKREELEERQYRIVGNHSAVRTCNWLKESLNCREVCYKQKFYGIKSHRCLQMTPALLCNQRCKHCWRDTSFFSEKWGGPVDDPVDIIDGCIEAHRDLIMGFGGNENVPDRKFEEAKNPNQAAISLTGEPMFYPKISGLLKEFHSRDFSTFLVTNGTFPERVQKLEESPTNFYVSMEAPNRKLYQKICNPANDDNWQKLQRTLDLISELNSTNVLRVTAMEGINMNLASSFRNVIESSDFDYVEVKAYMHIGYSQDRLSRESMPKFDKVREFANDICDNSSYNVTNSDEKSRVVLLES